MPAGIVGLGVKVIVGVSGTDVAVGGTGVAVGGKGVAVGGTWVAVGGTAVAVGGMGVAVGGTWVAVGGIGVAVGGTGVKVGDGAHAASAKTKSIRNKIRTFICFSLEDRIVVRRASRSRHCALF